MLVTQYQARQRFLVIPPSLQNAIFSPQNTEIISEVAFENNLNDDQSLKLPELIGWMLLGFIHLEDLPKEIQNDLSIPQQTALSITNSLTSKIFYLIKNELDKTYAPVPEEEPAELKPKIIQEIKAPVPTPTPASAAPSSIPPLKPITPVVPTNSTSPANFPPPARPDITTAKSTPIPQNLPSPSIPKPAPKPFVIQTESVSRPILNAPNFNIPTIAEDVMGENKKGFGPMPTASAVIEFGGMPVPKTPTPQSSVTPKVTVVRFGNEKSGAPAGSLPVTPPTPEPMRTITEITPESLRTDSSIPKPTIQPSFTPLSQIPVPSLGIPKPATAVIPAILKASVPPATPNPVSMPVPKPSNQPVKVIQKDYSETEK